MKYKVHRFDINMETDSGKLDAFRGGRNEGVEDESVAC